MADEQQSTGQNNQNEEITLEKLQQDLDQAINGWKRTAADFENYKRRKEAENKELIEFAKEVTVARLLPILDSLEQALRHAPEGLGVRDEGQEEFFKKYQQWQKGIEVLLAQLDKVLAEMGVKKIEAIGKKFDPNFHEAVRQVEGEEDNMIVEELQSGFLLNGKVIRPSQVAISKKVKN